MTEISPRFTYSPDDILQLRSDFSDDVNDEYLHRILEPVENSDDYEVEVDGEEYLVRADIVELLGDSVEDTPGNRQQRAAEIISTLRPFTYFDHFEKRDGVFSLDFWSDRVVGGVVYPQLQRWLNADQLDETTGRSIIQALQTAISKRDRRLGHDQLYLRGSAVQVGDPPYSSSIILNQAEYKLTKTEITDTEYRHLTAEVEWGLMIMTTLGDCACVSIDGQHRSSGIYLENDRSRLYELVTHNVFSAPESLSLGLGLGRVAYFAAQYEGKEDITADAEWTESRY